MGGLYSNIYSIIVYKHIEERYVSAEYLPYTKGEQYLGCVICSESICCHTIQKIIRYSSGVLFVCASVNKIDACDCGCFDLQKNC